jgi:hypothetical protein
MITVNRPSGTGDFVGDDNEAGGGVPALSAIMLVNRFPHFGLDRSHRGIKQQTAKFARIALGQTPAPRFVTGIIGSGVKARECDERIRIAEINPLQRVGQCHAHHRPPPPRWFSALVALTRVAANTPQV